MIENNQAIETTELYTGILESITTSYSSLLSNEMNNIMKTLTLFTVLLTLPTLVFSFFGMNVHSMKKLFIVALYRRYLTCTRYNSKYLLMAKTKIITANYKKSTFCINQNVDFISFIQLKLDKLCVEIKLK